VKSQALSPVVSLSVGLAVAFASVVNADVASSQTWGKPLGPKVEAELNRLVIEEGRGGRFEGDVLRVSPKGGWVRTRRILSDFVMTAEFRLLSPKAELGVGIRTINTASEWPRRGYRLQLNSSSPATLTAKGRSLKTTGNGAVTPTLSTWQSLKVAAEGTRLEISVDGQPVGTYETEVRAGSVLFEAKRGEVEIRKVTFDLLRSQPVMRADATDQPELASPILVKEVKPNYSRNAMGSKTQGIINYEAIVLTDGTVGAVRLTSLLHPELEHAGLEAIRQWKFTPARLGGSPIPTVVEIEMSFTLK
jgi:TonB family protein